MQIFSCLVFPFHYVLYDNDTFVEPSLYPSLVTFISRFILKQNGLAFRFAHSKSLETSSRNGWDNEIQYCRCLSTMSTQLVREIFFRSASWSDIRFLIFRKGIILNSLKDRRLSLHRLSEVCSDELFPLWTLSMPRSLQMWTLWRHKVVNLPIGLKQYIVLMFCNQGSFL